MYAAAARERLVEKGTAALVGCIGVGPQQGTDADRVRAAKSANNRRFAKKRNEGRDKCNDAYVTRLPPPPPVEAPAFLKHVAPAGEVALSGVRVVGSELRGSNNFTQTHFPPSPVNDDPDPVEYSGPTIIIPLTLNDCRRWLIKAQSAERRVGGSSVNGMAELREAYGLPTQAFDSDVVRWRRIIDHMHHRDGPVDEELAAVSPVISLAKPDDFIKKRLYLKVDPMVLSSGRSWSGWALDGAMEVIDELGEFPLAQFAGVLTVGAANWWCSRKWVDNRQWNDHGANRIYPISGLVDSNIGNVDEINAMSAHGFNAFREVSISIKVLSTLTIGRMGKPSAFTQQQYASQVLKDFGDSVLPAICINTASYHHQTLLATHYLFKMQNGNVNEVLERF